MYLEAEYCEEEPIVQNPNQDQGEDEVAEEIQDTDEQSEVNLTVNNETSRDGSSTETVYDGVQPGLELLEHRAEGDVQHDEEQPCGNQQVGEEVQGDHHHEGNIVQLNPIEVQNEGGDDIDADEFGELQNEGEDIDETEELEELQHEGESDNDADAEDEESEPEDIDWNNKQQNPATLPEAGQIIIYWSRKKQGIVEATVIRMHRTMRYRWPHWRNIECNNTGRQYSINLDIVCEDCIVWRYLVEDQPWIPTENNLPQVDGNYTIVSETISENVFTEYDMDYLDLGNSASVREKFEITVNRKDNNRLFGIGHRLEQIVNNGEPSERISPPSVWRRRWNRIRDYLRRLGRTRQ